MTKYANTLIVECNAPKDLFVEDYPVGVSEETQRIVEEARGIPCEGGGIVFPECARCPWCGGSDWVDFEEVEDGYKFSWED